jgi:uncharacterized protein
MNAIAGFAGYFGQADVTLDWPLMVNFTFVASLGILAGSYSTRYFNAKQLQKSFGYFLLAVAAFILFQQRDRLPRFTQSESLPTMAQQGSQGHQSSP